MVGAVRSELRKIFTTRLWWGMLIGVVIVGAGLSAAFAGLVSNDPGAASDQGGFGANTAATMQAVLSAGFIVFSLTALFPLALGIILITQEFRHKTFTATVLTTPRRSVVVVSKILAIVVIAAVYAVVYDIASVAGGAGVLKARGLNTFVTDPEVVKTLLLMVMAFVVWALLGFGFGILVRNQIAAVLAGVGVTLILQLALNIVFSIKGWETALKFVPGNLTGSMLITSDSGGLNGPAGPAPFSWWASALILVGYAAVMTVVGSVITARRDIT
ncbi:ABC transporter permease subunit [Dermatophilaceae bacterium Soc4.6]